jgi:hypothetical protein
VLLAAELTKDDVTFREFADHREAAGHSIILHVTRSLSVVPVETGRDINASVPTKFRSHEF